MIDILMATFNGEKYISAQLDSIILQTREDWHLYIIDDASSDKTVEIINKYIKKDPDKITLFENKKNNGNICENFFFLIEKSKGELVFFADQDDIWKRDKLEEMSKLFKANKPMLVFSDMTVIDKRDNITAPSFVKMQALDVKHLTLRKLLVQNCVTGCSMAVNRSLLNIIKAPFSLPLHDWWIACCAVLKGEIIYCKKAYTYYRKHDKNVRGARKNNSLSYILSRINNKDDIKKMLSYTYDTAFELRSAYGASLGSDLKTMLDEIAILKHKGKVVRLLTHFKYGLWKSGIIRKIGQLIYI